MAMLRRAGKPCVETQCPSIYRLLVNELMADLYRDLYLYQPVVELSVISAGAFMIVVLAHAYIFLRRKTWFFWPMLIGTISKLKNAGVVSFSDLRNQWSA